MKYVCYIVVLSLITVCVANAEPANKQTIQKLLNIMKVKEMTDSMYMEMMPVIKDSMFKSLPESANKIEAVKKIDEMLPMIQDIIKQELSWEKMEPVYIQIYTETFTEEELTGIIKFYESPVGISLLNKMPVVMQKSMSMMSAKMPDILKTMNAMVYEKIMEKK